jgi:translation initiation factor 1
MSPARPVFSTGPDGTRSVREGRGGGEPAEPQRDLPPERHAVRVRLDRSGRKGKQVTVMGPLFLRREGAQDLLKQLRKQCGTGGTLKLVAARTGEPAFEAELQGDHRERLLADLLKRGFPTKLSGG